MRRNLHFNYRQPLQTLFLLLTLLAAQHVLLAQCGLSSFKEPAANLNPTTSWQNVNVGSGTYADVNIVAGNIYSFRYQGSSALSYTWDMTLSNTSATLPYNNSTMPIRDPWTGGECPPNARPQSAEWYATFNGTVRVNTKTWNGVCNDHVFGLGSATLQYKTCTAASDPGTGVNAWNVEAFVTTDMNIPNPNARYGYYVDNNLSMNTSSAWGTGLSPSSAPGWSGCEVPVDNFTVRARRTGFPCGLYNLQLNASDDNVRVLVNGVQIYTAPCCITTPIQIGNVGGYVLGATDNIEVLMSGVCGPEGVNLQLVPQAVPVVSGGTIGGIPNNTNLCVGQTVGNFTNTLSASGGTSGLNNGGTLTYDWEVSIDNGVTWNSVGVATATWNSLDTVPVGGTYTIRRRAFDKCNSEGFSNTITLFGRPLPNGGLSPNTQTICPGTSTNLVLNFTSGSAPYNVSFTDGLNTYVRSGKYNGDTIQVSPSATTIYTLTQLVDSFGCVRTGGFNSAAQVLLVPQINIPSVTSTNVSCFGGSNGTITVNANGGQPPLSYSIDNGVTFQTSSQFLGLPIGSYTIVVSDGFGCQTVYATNPVVLTQPTDVTNTSVVVDASCANVFDGTITVTASGGVSPYTYSLNGGPTQPGNVFAGLGAGNYLISVFDANGCLDTSSNSIANTYIISVDTVSQTDVSCAGGADGAVTVIVNGGIPPYSYSINGITFQPSGTFTGLSAGSYTVVGRDSKGCTEFAIVNIGQPGLLTATIDSVSNILCSGSATGSIFITPSGGTAPYTFVWSNGAISEDVIGVGAGVYNVTVQDAKGCVASAGVTLSQPLPLFLTVASFNNLACFNNNTGKIDILVSGGTSPYSYLWSNGATTPNLNGVAASTYTVTVSDANGCTSTLTQTLTQPAVLTASVTAGTISCNGGVVNVDLTVTGGTTPYSYFWNNGATSEDLLGVGVGTYAVQVTDNNGCTANSSITITQPSALSLSSTTTNILCNGGTTGAIDLTVSGGTAAYTYTWSNGALTEDLTGVGAGTYTVSVQDANGCTATHSATLTQPTSLNASIVSFVNVSCNGGANGSINTQVSGGAFPYSYLWSNGATTPNLNGVAASTYTVTVSDANGCTSTLTQTLTQPAVLTASVTASTISCNGGVVNVDLTVTGGTTPYSYFWNNGATSEDLLGVGVGTYAVQVTDNNGCTANSSITITQPSALSLSSTTTNILCNGGTTGAIDLTVSGGTAAYTYTWSNGALTEDLTGVGAGTYTVSVQDANGCTATHSATLTQPTSLNASIVSFVNVSCNGGANGSINTQVSGGAFPYSYLWSNGATTPNLNGVAASTYTVTVSDANGCTSTLTQTLTQPAVLTASVTAGTISCNGGVVNVDLTVTGGTTPYSYFWNNGATSEDLLGVGVGTYAVQVTDNNGCTANSSITITQPSALSLSSTTTNILCNGGTTGAIDLTVSGGTAAYTYTWSNGALTEDLTGIGAGTYTVSVQDANGCTAVAVATITEPSALTLVLAGSTNVSCNGGNNGTIDINVFGGTPLYSYIWSNGQITEDLNSLVVGTYTVTVADANSCTATTSVTLTSPSAITTSVTKVDVTCPGAANGSVDLTVSGGVAPYTYNWSNGATTQDLVNVTGGTYSVVVTDANGCTSANSIVVNEGLPLVISGIVTNVLCNGNNSGAIDISVTGGNVPYSYSWSNGAITEDITAVGAGSYIVTVNDVNLCSATATFVVGQPTALVLNATPQDVTCSNGANGSIDITINGGVFPYSFNWSNGATTEDVNGLSGGSYAVTIVDANACSLTATYTINEPSAITSSVVGVNVTCFGANDGSADLSVSGGTAPYTYLWNTFQATEDLTAIGGGLYYVIITDANGCEKRDSVIIAEPAAITILTNVTNVTCNGALTGGIDITLNGGTPTILYTWSNGAVTEDLTGVGAGTYTVTIVDGNSCSASASATISQPTALVLNATPQDVTCANGANGSIDITINGGVFPYSFNWSNGATTEDVNGLSGGSYAVTIVDANACSLTATYTINEPSAITSSVVGVNVTCFGANDGSADLSVSGGTAPYTYLWNTFQATEDLTAIGGGLYYVIITDANGCEKRDSVIITQPSALTITLSATNILCSNGNNGAVTATVTGGTGAYSYSWSNGETTATITGISAGTYSLTVLDANNCSATASVTITQPTALIITGTAQDVSCANGANGSIDVFVNGGVFPYTYLWNTGAISNNLNNIAAGTYSITATDVNGCTVSQSFTVNQPAAIVSSVVGTNVTCNGLNNGSATLTVSGGTAPYYFLWSNFQGSQNVTGLDGGLYYVIITDAKGCEHRDSVLIAEPAALTLSLVVSNITCFNANDGAIDLTVTGGTSAYSYAWSNGATTQDLLSLPGGQYVVTVTDANLCTATASAIIVNPSALTPNYIVTHPLCFGDANGAIDMIPSGGTPTYTFNWSNGATTEDLSGLVADTYFVTVTDSKNCIKIDSIVVTDPNPLVTSGFIKNVTCAGSQDGFVDITAYGGTQPYSFSWSTAQSTEDIGGLPGGNYTVFVTDVNGCQVASLYIVTEPLPLVVDVVGVNPNCFGAALGQVAAVPTGGTTPYHYLWNTFDIDSSISGLFAGKYTVQLTDSNGCYTYDSLTLTQPTEILLSGVVTDATCFGGSNGAIDVTVSGGTPTYTYSWTPAATSQDLLNVSAGVYVVTVTDAASCQKTQSFTVGQGPEIFAQIAVVDPLCFGSNTATVTAIAGGGVGPYTYVWNTTPANTNISVSGLSAGTYSLTVTDASNCTVLATKTVNQPAQIIVNTTSIGSKCFNTASGSVTVSIAGGVAPFTYTLNGVVKADSVFNGLAPGDYLVLVTDVNGCSGTASFTVGAPSLLSVSVVTAEQVILTGMQTQLTATPVSTSSIIGYTWEPVASVVFDNCADPDNCNNPSVAPLTTTTYTVTVMNADSCTATDTVTVYVNNEASSFIPTAFTPNADNLNDRFEFDILGVKNIDISIFNRWGEKVYENPNQTNGITNADGWDGTVHGKPAPFDTYVYQLNLTYFDDVVKQVTGTVTLLR